MLTDSHCHLASHRFDPSEQKDLIRRANASGVTRMVTLATNLDDLEANLAIAHDPGIHACIGIHPCDVHQAPDDAIERLAPYVADPRVCAIGETGLDYYHPAPEGWSEGDFHKRQQRLLHQHFELAARARLNVVIHTRDREGFASYEDALTIYQEFHSQVSAVFHCFVGPWENAERVMALGGRVSFGGVATFKSANAVRDCLSQCPAGTFMLETDAPYLAPVPHRGKRNEPAFVRHTAELIATHRGESLDELSSHTNDCASTFFRFREAKN